MKLYEQLLDILVQLGETLETVFGLDDPCIIDVHVNPGELTIPPRINAGQALGCGLSKMKEFFE